jgi:hypothetical protein
LTLSIWGPDKRSGFTMPSRHSLAAFAFMAPVLLCTIVSLPASAQTTYRDSAGKFSLNVPAGWQTEKQDGTAVKISNHDVSAIAAIDSTSDGSSPQAKEVLDAYESQFKQTCPSIVGPPQHGDAVVAGLRGLYFQLSCKDATLGQWTMRMEVATAGSSIVLLQSSGPSSAYSSAKLALDGIAGSFHVSGRDAQSQAAPSNRDANQQGGAASGVDQQKLRALEDACSSGVLTPDECKAKRAALMAIANSSNSDSSANSAANNPKLQALEKACKAGVFTPEECETKRAALISSGSRGGQGVQGNSPAFESAMRNQDAPPHSLNLNQQDNGEGTLYSDPQGVFTLMIPQGWKAETKHGCYGPSGNCPKNATGVNVYPVQGKTWAFIAVFSGRAKSPTDLVSMVAGEYDSEYRDFKLFQNEPSKYKGLDVAFGTFTATDQNGAPISLTAIGIAAPNGRLYVVSSYVPQADLKTDGAVVESILNTLKFANQ